MPIMGIKPDDIIAVAEGRAKPAAAANRDLGDFGERAARVAAAAAKDAEAVDREARFPGAAIAAAKSNRLLGVLVPREFGGEEASIFDATEICYTLGRSCASAAMIVAMHY